MQSLHSAYPCGAPGTWQNLGHNLSWLLHHLLELSISSTLNTSFSSNLNVNL